MLNTVYRAFEKNWRHSVSARQTQILGDALLQSRSDIVDLINEKTTHRRLKECFQVLYEKWHKDESGLRQYKRQRSTTLEVVEHMQNMTKAAELKAEKVQMDQEEMLSRVVSFVKKNRHDQQRRTVS